MEKTVMKIYIHPLPFTPRLEPTDIFPWGLLERADFLAPPLALFTGPLPCSWGCHRVGEILSEAFNSYRYCIYFVLLLPHQLFIFISFFGVWRGTDSAASTRSTRSRSARWDLVMGISLVTLSARKASASGSLFKHDIEAVELRNGCYAFWSIQPAFLRFFRSWMNHNPFIKVEFLETWSKMSNIRKKSSVQPWWDELTKMSTNEQWSKLLWHSIIRVG